MLLPEVVDCQRRSAGCAQFPRTLISFTCLLSGGETPYRKAATCVRRSAAVMNARKMFFGRTYVKEAASSLTSSFET